MKKRSVLPFAVIAALAPWAQADNGFDNSFPEGRIIDAYSSCYRSLDSVCPGYDKSAGRKFSHAFGYDISPSDHKSNHTTWEARGVTAQPPAAGETPQEVNGINDLAGRTIKTGPVFAKGTFVQGTDAQGRNGVYITQETIDRRDPNGAANTYFCAYPDSLLTSKSKEPKSLEFEVQGGMAMGDGTVHRTSHLTFFADYDSSKHDLVGTHDAPYRQPETVKCFATTFPDSLRYAYQDDIGAFFGNGDKDKSLIHQCAKDRLAALESPDAYAKWVVEHMADPYHLKTQEQRDQDQHMAFAEWTQKFGDKTAEVTRAKRKILAEIQHAAAGVCFKDLAEAHEGRPPIFPSPDSMTPVVNMVTAMEKAQTPGEASRGTASSVKAGAARPDRN